MINFLLKTQYHEKPRTESDTLDHGGANCLGGFEFRLTRRAYTFKMPSSKSNTGTLGS